MNAIEKAKRLVEQGNGLIGAGRLPAATAKFEEALRLLPGHPGVLNNLDRAGDLVDYDRRIRALVAAPQRLSAAREQLARARTAGVLFNPAGCCRALEAALASMIAR